MFIHEHFSNILLRNWNFGIHKNKLTVNSFILIIAKITIDNKFDTQLCWIRQKNIWAATWQNQQSECAPSENSDQPGHPPSLIRVFAGRMKKALALSTERTAKTLIRLGRCQGWSESSLDAQSVVGFVMRWFICVFLASGPYLGFCPDPKHLVVNVRIILETVVKMQFQYKIFW